MNRSNFPFPEEIFPGVIYSANDNKAFGSNGTICKASYDPFLRDAGSYIQKFQQTSGKLPFDTNKYNFSVFQSNNLTDIHSMHYGYIQFLTKTVNYILEIPPETQRSILPRYKYVQEKVDRDLGLLGTQIFPDADYMLSLNYEDFPVGFLGFNILEDGNIEVIQLQSGKIVDETRKYFIKKQHYLNGFEWGKVLISFLEDFFKKQGFTGEITIQSSENNGKYTSPTNLSSDENTRQMQEKRNKALLKHYNATAETLGYTRNTPSRHYKTSQYLDYSKTI